MRYFKPLGIILLIVALFGFSVPQGVLAAQNWTAHAGSGVGGGMVAGIKFYPSTITINEGDSITWRVEGDAHTISFLSGAQAPSPFSAEAANPAGGSTYNGTGFVNSGIVEPGGTYTLKFTKAGSYDYFCLIHPGMTAKVVVQPAGTPYPYNPTFYDQKAQLDQTTDSAAGLSLLSSAPYSSSTHNSDGTHTISGTAGIGNGTESVMRFLPEVLVITQGDSITWKNRDPMMPHTVSFPPQGEDVTETFAPAGGSTYDGSVFTSSGILGPNQSYTLKFTKAGNYNYECILHDSLGMRGQVIVVPKF